MEDEQAEEIIQRLERIESNCMTQAQANEIKQKLEEIAAELAEFRAEYSKS